MTYPEIDAMIGEVGLPYAYYQFPETGQQPPFICWMLDGIDDLYADNINYQRIVVLAVELYTDEKDFEKEAINAGREYSRHKMNQCVAVNIYGISFMMELKTLAIFAVFVYLTLLAYRISKRFPKKA